MVPKRTVSLGFPVGLNAQGKRRFLSWYDFNAIVLAGSSGSGKSQSTTYWLSSLVYKGVQLIMCEYDSAVGVADTLYTRTEHLSSAFLQPFAMTTQEIVHHIQYCEHLIEYRKENVHAFHFPVMFVIDEFSALYINSTIGQRVPLVRLLNLINTGRKYNIRFLLAGQTWGQISSNNLAQLREACNTKVVHRIESRNLDILIGGTQEEMRLVRRLQKGYVYYNQEVLYVPSQLTEETKLKVAREAEMYTEHYQKTAHLSQKEFLAYLLNINYKQDRRDAQIRALLMQNPGITSRDIYKQIGGNSTKTYADIRRIKAEITQNTASEVA